MSGKLSVDGSGLARRRFLGLSLGLASAAWLPLRGVLAAGDTPHLRVRRLSWAGIRLQLPGATLFIDPLISRQAWGDALQTPLVALGDAVGETSVLVTHAHYDHFDPAAVAAALAKGGTLAHPAGTLPRPVPAQVRTRACAPWEPQLFGDFTATPVPASDGYGDPQVSWIVSAGGRRIFHGGDTLWHGHWWRIGRQFGPFDAAFLPVNGARFGFLQPAGGQPGVLTPEQAVAAAEIIGARRLVPIHYGVRGMDKYVEMEDAIPRVQAAARERGVQVAVLEPGAWLDW